MRIKKMYQSALPAGSVLNTDSNSQTSTFSCNYLNQRFGPKFIEVVSTTNLTPDANNNIYVKWDSIKYNTENYFFLMNNIACCDLEEHIVEYSITLWIENVSACYAWVEVFTEDFYGGNSVEVGSYMIGKSTENWQSVTITGFAKMGTSTSRIIYPRVHYNVANSSHKTKGGTYLMSCYMTLKVID